MDRNTETIAHGHTDRIARAAWFCAFVLPLILVALLLGAKSSQAAPSIPGLAPLALEEELDFEEEGELEEEGEFAELECEIAEEEAAEGEISEAEADAICREAEEIAGGTAGPSSTAASRCPLRSARAHASTRHGKLKLTVGYTTLTPVNVKIQVRAGSAGVGTFRRHLGRSGVLRLTRKLGRKQQRKRLRVRIRVLPSARARSCGLVQVVANKVV